MARQLFLEAVLDEPRRALRAFEAMATRSAERQRRVTATIEKKQRLLAFLERFRDCADEALREPFSRLKLLGFEIDQRNVGHRDAREAAR